MRRCSPRSRRLSAAQRGELHRLEQVVACFSIPGAVCKQLSPAQRKRRVELLDKRSHDFILARATAEKTSCHCRNWSGCDANDGVFSVWEMPFSP